MSCSGCRMTFGKDTNQCNHTYGGYYHQAKFHRGSDGKCTLCHKTEGDHYNHLGTSKFCYICCNCYWDGEDQRSIFAQKACKQCKKKRDEWGGPTTQAKFDEARKTEEARRQAEAEAKRKAEEEAKRKAEEEANRKAASAAARVEVGLAPSASDAELAQAQAQKRQAAAAAHAKVGLAPSASYAELAQAQAKAEEARCKAEEEASRKAEAEAKRKAEEEAKRKAEARAEACAALGLAPSDSDEEVAQAQKKLKAYIVTPSGSEMKDWLLSKGFAENDRGRILLQFLKPEYEVTTLMELFALEDADIDEILEGLSLAKRRALKKHIKQDRDGI